MSIDDIRDHALTAKSAPGHPKGTRLRVTLEGVTDDVGWLHIGDGVRLILPVMERAKSIEVIAPPSLREQVYEVLISPPRGALERADAVLAVVADWLAAQPMPYPDVVTRGQRDHDVRLLRGES